MAQAAKQWQSHHLLVAFAHWRSHSSHKADNSRKVSLLFNQWDDLCPAVKSLTRGTLLAASPPHPNAMGLLDIYALPNLACA